MVFSWRFERYKSPSSEQTAFKQTWTDTVVIVSICNSGSSCEAVCYGPDDLYGCVGKSLPCEFRNYDFSSPVKQLYCWFKFSRQFTQKNNSSPWRRVDLSLVMYINFLNNMEFLDPVIQGPRKKPKKPNRKSTTFKRHHFLLLKMDIVIIHTLLAWIWIITVHRTIANTFNSLQFASRYGMILYRTTNSVEEIKIKITLRRKSTEQPWEASICKLECSIDEQKVSLNLRLCDFEASGFIGFNWNMAVQQTHRTFICSWDHEHSSELRLFPSTENGQSGCRCRTIITERVHCKSKWGL